MRYVMERYEILAICKILQTEGFRCHHLLGDKAVLHWKKVAVGGKQQSCERAARISSSTSLCVTPSHYIK
jgi:hypothetical protein